MEEFMKEKPIYRRSAATLLNIDITHKGLQEELRYGNTDVEYVQKNAQLEMLRNYPSKRSLMCFAILFISHSK